MRRSDRKALREIRAAMAALDEPVDDVSDRRLRAALVAVTGWQPDAVALTARMLRATHAQAASAFVTKAHKRSAPVDS